MKKKLIFTMIIGTLCFFGNLVFAMEDFQGASQKKSIAPTWNFLKEGEEIEIILPSAAPLNSEQVLVTKDIIRSHGFNPFLAENAINQKASRLNYYANTDQERTKNFINGITGKGKALWALLGGFGGAEVVEQVGHSSIVIPNNPKPIIGFSDITALHLLAATWGWPSLHGPVIGLGEELFSTTQSNINKSTRLSEIFPILKGEITELEYCFDVIYPGALSTKVPILASVLGGNLSIIENHNGTPTELKGRDRFVFFEDTPEDGKRFYRRLVGLMRAGVFNGAKAIIVGNMPIVEVEDSTAALKNLMKDFVVNYLLPRNVNIPVVYSPRFGHGPFNDIMPFGTRASLTVGEISAILKVSVNESVYAKAY